MPLHRNYRAERLNTTDKSLGEIYQQLTALATEAFPPSGITHDGSIDDNDFRVIPYPQDLRTRTRDGMTEIYRTMPTTFEDVVVASTKLVKTDPVGFGDSNFEATNWMKCYAWASWPKRADMLGVDNPFKLHPEQIDAMLAASAPAAKAKIKMVSSGGAVATGTSIAGTGKKRCSWNGHSGFSLARWMGANGWSGKEAVEVFQKIGMTEFGKSAVIGGVYAGKKGERGEPAPITPDQRRILESHRPNVSGVWVDSNGSTFDDRIRDVKAAEATKTKTTKSTREATLDKEFAAMKNAQAKHGRKVTKKKTK